MTSVISVPPLGSVFGQLTVCGTVDRTDPKHIKVPCICSCGKRTLSQIYHLRSGAAKSCGCTKPPRTHGASRRGGTPEYQSWRGMRERCSSSGHISYPWYGEQGVAVCDRWSSFEMFLADMGRKPSPKHWIERLDNTRGYEPGNCVWALPKQQARNTSRNHVITAFGRTQVLQDWADQTGLRYTTLLSRIRRGWSVEDALNPELKERRLSRLLAA
jgi:hypothetical protein